MNDSDAPDGFGKCALCRADNRYIDRICRGCGATLPWAVMGLDEVRARDTSIGTWSPGSTRDPALVLLLSLVTLGVYYLWWVYMVSSEVRDYLKEPGLSPVLEASLVGGSCTLYSIYWNYKLGKSLARMLEKCGRRPTDNSLLYSIVGLCGLFFVNAMMQQTALNEVWREEWAKRNES